MGEVNLRGLLCGAVVVVVVGVAVLVFGVPCIEPCWPTGRSSKKHDGGFWPCEAENKQFIKFRITA